MMGIRTVIYAFTMFEEPQDLQKVIQDINPETETAFTLNYSNLTDPEHFRAIYTLATNEESHRDIQIGLTSYCVEFWHIFSTFTDLRSLLKTKDLEDLFLRLLFHFIQVAIVNAQSIGGATSIDPNSASGVLTLCSLFNHSCVPNIVRICDDAINVVVVRRPIKAGEQLFESYVTGHYHNDLLTRQALLKPQYNIECQCEACVHDFPLLKDMPKRRSQLQKQVVKHHQQLLRDFDKKVSKKLFERYKKFLKEYRGQYLTYGICKAEENLMAAFCVLMADLPLAKVLKPV